VSALGDRTAAWIQYNVADGSISDLAQEVAWIARLSLPLRNFASASTVRRAMDSITMKLDGTQAAAPTVARRRAALFSVLEYAVELELLPSNQLKQLKLPRPIRCASGRPSGRRQPRPSPDPLECRAERLPIP